MDWDGPICSGLLGIEVPITPHGRGSTGGIHSPNRIRHNRPAWAGVGKERTFETHFLLAYRKQRKAKAAEKPKTKQPAKLKPVEKQTQRKIPVDPETIRERERIRAKTPKRKESGRIHANKRRSEDKALGKCRDCSLPAIPNQTRCENCAEKHRVSRRTSDARRRAAARGERAATTDRAGQ